MGHWTAWVTIPGRDEAHILEGHDWLSATMTSIRCGLRTEGHASDCECPRCAKPALSTLRPLREDDTRPRCRRCEFGE
jgi:hypothetical protein